MALSVAGGVVVVVVVVVVCLFVFSSSLLHGNIGFHLRMSGRSHGCKTLTHLLMDA